MAAVFVFMVILLPSHLLVLTIANFVLCYEPQCVAIQCNTQLNHWCVLTTQATRSRPSCAFLGMRWDPPMVHDTTRTRVVAVHLQALRLQFARNQIKLVQDGMPWRRAYRVYGDNRQ